MYSFQAYAAMLGDQLRVAAFRDAMAKVIKPGHTVLELGAGPGIFAVMAAKAGAAKVYAVDPSEYVTLAGEAALQNGVGDRLEVHKGLSTKWSPSQPIDVVLHDIRGVLPIHRGSLQTLVDLRARIAPTATLIPRRDRLFAALVSNKAVRLELVGIWSACTDQIDAAAYTRMAVNLCYRAHITRQDIASEVQPLGLLDYEGGLDLDANVSATWTMSRDCAADGIVVWFDSELADGVTYTSGPDNPQSIHGQAFFPLRESIALKAGDELRWSLHTMDVNTTSICWWVTKLKTVSGQILETRQGDLDIAQGKAGKTNTAAATRARETSSPLVEVEVRAAASGGA